jgi:DNA-binding response OmpR family regulator
MNHDPEFYDLTRKSADNETQFPRILIVEDDLTYEPIWRYVCREANINASILWRTDFLNAVQLINESREIGRPFDLIVSDISLDGPETGFDLWNEFHEQFNGRFILVSSADHFKDLKFVHQIGEPIYLKKPISTDEAIMLVHEALSRGGNFDFSS